jgi:CubicO group peptidase (beta-lactamase class C family)
MPRRFFFSTALSLALLSASSFAHAQGRSRSAGSLAAHSDSVFARFASRTSPGCTAGVARDGTPILERAYGLANLEYGVSLEPGSILESGSVAKQFTAAAITLLALDGKLSLDDDVRRYVPEVPRFDAPITIRHLLNHTSGLRDQWGLLGIEGRGPGTQVHSPATTLDLVKHQRQLNFPPGSEYLYSNTGFTLLGVIVERVSGRSLAEFTHQRLFQPLGMTHTSWRDDFRRTVPGRATAYSGDPRRGFTLDMPFTNIVGNGGLLTTVGDLLRWNENLDRPRVGGRAMAESLQVRGKLTNGRTISYALGLVVGSWNGVAEVSHSGSTAGYRTFLARYPDQRVSVAVLCNLASANPTALAHQLVAPLLPSRPVAVQSGAKGVTVRQRTLERYAGTYVDPRTDQLMRLSTRDGALVMAMSNDVTLAALSEERFRAANGSELVFGDGDGPAPAFALIRPEDDTAQFTRAAPFDAPLADFVGTYASDELDVQLVVELRGDSLVLTRRPADVMAMTPRYRDDFDVDELGNVRFARDGSGRVTGFAIYAGRVRDVRFRRVAGS